jgi:diadenosine tetraphosphatase ApaH/serine/threonine PP2A family protein phosphatase
MRLAVVSDVHSNLAALEAVLHHAEGENALDELWVLGDLVGYGPQPSECLALLRRYELRVVAGNHDLAAVGSIDTRDFNAAAATANRWNALQLGDQEKDFLRGLPRKLVLNAVSLVHGSLRGPVWEYMLSIDAALAQFRLMTTPFSLVGHTHVPLLFEEGRGGGEPEASLLQDGEVLELGDTRLIINPGGVGQPRDGDPRAAYAVYDVEAATFTFHRVQYDIARTQQAMTDADLPPKLIERLSHGR